jgi:hypothetical protein
MSEKMYGRRSVLKGAFAGLAAIPVVTVMGRAEAAAAPVKLDANDPMAKSLAYSANTATVDDKANATHKPDQLCSNCLQFQGKAGDAEGPCVIFGGKLVAAKGWCKVWAKKSA